MSTPKFPIGEFLIRAISFPGTMPSPSKGDFSIGAGVIFSVKNTSPATIIGLREI